GRLGPGGGLGLVLGSAGSPWSRAALDRGDGAPYRGRAGDGLWYRRAGPIDLEALAGRFARRDLAGLRGGTAGAGVGLLGARGGDLEWSVALERPGGDGEIAIERSGLWRAEAATRRTVGRASLSPQARGGSEGFRSLSVPERSGPARAVAGGAEAPAGIAGLRALRALWPVCPGLACDRGA